MSEEIGLTALDLLERSAKKAPDSVAIVSPDRSVTYGELQSSARKAAAALLKETQKPVIALFYPMSPEFVVAYFGVLYAGRQALPLNLLLPPEELKFILT